MAQPSFLSRLVDPVVGFLKNVPSTIRDGITEVADAISPARKRRRTSGSFSYQHHQSHNSTLIQPSTDNSLPPQPKRLRLSEASASNAAGSSVKTPVAFRPAQDLLATATSSAHPNAQIVSRDPFSTAQSQPPLPNPLIKNSSSDLHPSDTFPTPLAGMSSRLNIQKVFQYPFPDRRSSLTGLRDIWPSDHNFIVGHRRFSTTFNYKLNPAQLYWQRVEQRHRSRAILTGVPRGRSFESNVSATPPYSLTPRSALLDDVPGRRSSSPETYSRGDLHPQASLSRSGRRSLMRTKIQLQPEVRKKRYYNEQRVRRSHQASVKKLSAVALSHRTPSRTYHTEKLPQLSGRCMSKKTRETVPMPFIEILEKDSILGQKLVKMHGATLARLVKSQSRSRHRQLECWLAEQDLHEIQRKREEARRLNAIELKVWKYADDPSQKPPKDEGFIHFDYWKAQEVDWEEEMDDVAMAERAKQITVPEENAAFAALSESAIKRLRAAISDDSNHNEELARINGCVIRGGDLRRLKPNCWLNDEIVNAYMALLTSRTERLRSVHTQRLSSKTARIPHVKIMNSFFYSSLVQFNNMLGRYEYNYSKVRRWTRRFDIFSFDIMLIPINEQSVHWTLGVVNFRDCRVEHLDSMGTGGSASVREFLIRWLQDEAEDKQKHLDLSQWKTTERRVPIQENTDDCGVFLCKYADFICRGWRKFTFSQRHMNYFRARIAHELLMGRA